MSEVFAYPAASGENWKEELAKAGLAGHGTIVLEAADGSKAYAVWVENGLEFGFRNDLHAFPILGAYWQQQLNMLPLKFSITCWVGGKDYLKRRDAMFKVLMRKASSDEPLMLALPSYESVPVQFEGGSTKESAGKQGYCQFVLNFTQIVIAEPSRELVLVDAEAALEDAAREVEIVLGDELGREAGSNVLAELKQGFKEMSELWQRGTSKLSIASTAMAEVQRGIMGLSAGIDELLGRPSDLLQGFTSVANTLLGAVLGKPARAERELRKLLSILKGWGSYEPEPVITASQQEAARRLKIVASGLAAIGMAQVLPQIGARDKAEAEGLYFDLLKLEQGLVNPPALLMYALEQQRLALREVLRSKGWFALAASKEIEIARAVPSLVLAHKLGVSEEELLAMNGTANAFFMKGKLRYV